jgi:hypothetical protein
MSLYHHEAGQKDFLVLAGECTSLIEDEERPLHAWAFVHCPSRTAHDRGGGTAGSRVRCGCLRGKGQRPLPGRSSSDRPRSRGARRVDGGAGGLCLPWRAYARSGARGLPRPPRGQPVAMIGSNNERRDYRASARAQSAAAPVAGRMAAAVRRAARRLAGLHVSAPSGRDAPPESRSHVVSVVS